MQLDEMHGTIISAYRRRIKELGLTQRELAELTGFKQSAISRLLSGAHSPKMGTLVTMNQVLGLDFVWKLGERDERRATDEYAGEGQRPI